MSLELSESLKFKELSSKQEEALQNFLQGKDVFVSVRI